MILQNFNFFARKKNKNSIVCIYHYPYFLERIMYLALKQIGLSYLALENLNFLI